MKRIKKTKKLIYIFLHYLGIFSILYFFFLSFFSNLVFNLVEENFINNYKDISDYTSNLENGDFESLPTKDLFGKKGYFDILDENYNTIYSSSEIHTYTKKEINNIPKEDIFNYGLFSLKNDESILIHFDIDFNNNYYLLDKDYNVLMSNDSNSPKKFEKEYIDNIEQSFEDYNEFFITKEFNYNNKTHILVAFVSKFEESMYTYTVLKSTVYYINIAIYIIGFTSLIYILNKKINKPLDDLGKAITKYTEKREKTNLKPSGILELESINEKFEYMTQKLDETEKANKKFQSDRQLMLASISHDLKTPITVIQGYSKAIVDKVITGEEIIKKSQLIYDKSCYLNELVDNFTEFSKLDHTNFKYDFKDIDIAEFVRNYIVIKYDELESKNIDLNIDIPETKIIKKIDTQQFNRVLNNIVNNALKYGGNNISIKIQVDNDKIAIFNSGKAIEETNYSQLFKPFVKGDLSRNEGGSGLGLAIVRKIIQDHGFTINIVSNKDSYYKTGFIINLNKN